MIAFYAAGGIKEWMAIITVGKVGMGKIRTWCLACALTVFGTTMLSAADSDDRIGRIETLRAEIARHDDLYFKQAAPEISDAAYDALKRELAALESGSMPIDDGAGIGDDRLDRFPDVDHRVRMLSLEKAYDAAALSVFDQRVRRAADGDEVVYVLEPKVDGIAISATYEHGQLTRLATRGDGRTGDDVTMHAASIAGLPLQLASDDGNDLPAVVELVGEAYVSLAEFARINRERLAAGEAAFAHPRNLAAGTLKQMDSVEVSRRGLAVVIHGWGAWSGAVPAPESHRGFSNWVQARGLQVLSQMRTVSEGEDLWRAVAQMGDDRHRWPFAADGVVVKVDATSLRERVGESPYAPRWAIACKFPSERAQTRVVAISIQVGRTGVLTPLAELEPVRVGGALVSRVSLYNRDHIARLDVRVGDQVEIARAGEVIPEIVGVVLGERSPDAPAYVFPGICPECHGPVGADGNAAMVRCLNPDCPAQLRRKLEHFASSSAADLKGFGPVVIGRLVALGRLRSPADFYALAEADLGPVVGPTTAVRLLASVEASRNAELWRVIHGLGLPGVGAVKARALAARIDQLEELLELESPAWETEVDGEPMMPIDSATIEAVVRHFERKEHRDAVLALAVARRQR